MIFTTFQNNDIDKWTAKIGVFGRSFNELGTSINGAFKTYIDNIDDSTKNVSFWDALQQNLAPGGLIKNSLGEVISKDNIDSYIGQLDLDSAKKKLSDIFDWNDTIQNSDKTWEDYFDTLGNGEQYIVDLIKDTDDLSKLTGQDLVAANENARNAVIAQNEALGQQTIKARAGRLGLQALAMAGNMLVSFLVGSLISVLYETANASNEIADSAQQIGSSFEETTSDLDDYQTKVEDLQETINDSSSSISDIRDARKELMSIQDDLIEKYGTEEESVKRITDAVNGESDAWDKLKKKKWTQAKNEFNDTGKDGMKKGMGRNIAIYLVMYFS